MTIPQQAGLISLPSILSHGKLKRIIFPVLLSSLIGTSSPPFAKQTYEEFSVPPPPFKEGMFPCSNCHASMEAKKKKRELKEEHTTIQLRHAETMRWCLDCHYGANRDKLRLFNGDLISFDKSYLLCGECHGNIFKDWKAGIHGKRQGYFAGGKRTYLLCVHCHDSHSPRSKPIKPEPPPFRPKEKKDAK